MKDRNLRHSDNWKTPETFYNGLNEIFNFDFDPCPYNHDMSWDGLTIDWGEEISSIPHTTRGTRRHLLRKLLRNLKKENYA